MTSYIPYYIHHLYRIFSIKRQVVYLKLNLVDPNTIGELIKNIKGAFLVLLFVLFLNIDVQQI